MISEPSDFSQRLKQFLDILPPALRTHLMNPTQTRGAHQVSCANADLTVDVTNHPWHWSILNATSCCTHLSEQDEYILDMLILLEDNYVDSFISVQGCHQELRRAVELSELPMCEPILTDHLDRLESGYRSWLRSNAADAALDVGATLLLARSTHGPVRYESIRTFSFSDIPDAKLRTDLEELHRNRFRPPGLMLVSVFKSSTRPAQSFSLDITLDDVLASYSRSPRALVMPAALWPLVAHGSKEVRVDHALLKEGDPVEDALTLLRDDLDGQLSAQSALEIA